MKTLPLTILCFALLGATAGAELKGPELQPFEPAYEKPQASTEEGRAPLSARGMVFELICTQVNPGVEIDGVANVGFFDHRCTFHTMDRAEYEIPQDSAEVPEDEHLMRIYTYIKTGADTAVIRCWEGLVYDDGTEAGGSVYDIHLDFSNAGSGSAQFATYGHAFEHHGCGIFTLHH